MRSYTAFAALLLAGVATIAIAQDTQPTPPPLPTTMEVPRSGDQPSAQQQKSDKVAREAAKKNNEGRKILQAALTAGNARVQALDYDGAIAAYKEGVAAAPAGHPNLFELHQALASAYRGRGLKTFNDAIAPGVTQLPPQVKAAAAADYRTSLEESGIAATIAGGDQAKLAKLGPGMRESSRLWAQTDRAGVAASARSTLDLEMRLFDEWAPTATPVQLAQFTPGLAFALLPKDKEAALKYADAMFDKQPSDIDTVIAYGQIIGDAKLPPADPRRAKAKTAVVNAIASGVISEPQRARLRSARIQLESST